MKIPLFILGTLSWSLIGLAQSGTTLAALPGVTLVLKGPDAGSPRAFSHFEVVDERPDTARIGIHTFIPTLGHSRNRQLVFKQPAALEIADYLNAHFARPGAPWSALVVLRNLWLSDANYLKEDKVKNPDILEERTHIRLKAEIYAFNDSSYYIPILRFDTLQTYKRSNPYNNLNTYYSLWEKDLTAVVGDMTDSASGLAIARTVQGRRIRREDILQYNRSRFDAAITGNSPLTPGVYASFEEVRNNAPSIQNFEIRQEKQDHLLYIRQADGTSYYAHDAWGYCDGKSIFIMRDGKLYAVWKEGKAFYFFSQAFRENTVPVGELVPAIIPSTLGANGGFTPGSPAMLIPDNMKIVTNKQRIYTVDMDSGIIY